MDGSINIDKGISIGKLPDNFYYENNKNNLYKMIKPQKEINSFLSFSETCLVIVKKDEKGFSFIKIEDKNLIGLFKIIFEEF